LNLRYQKVLFIIPPFEFGSRIEGVSKVSKTPTMLLPGIGYLSETLTKNKITNNIFDFRLDYTFSDLKEKIDIFKPDLIAITVPSTYRRDLPFSIVQYLKQNDIQNYDVIIGGPHVSLFGKVALEECDADYGIMFEGEFPLLELCQGMSLEKIGNLIYRNQNTLVQNPIRSFINEIDQIPFPRYEMFEIKKYTEESIPIITSRGCPYQCIFCTTGSMGNLYRSRSAENVVNELIFWYAKNRRIFDFLDDNFTLKKDRLYQIIDLIEKNNLSGLQLATSNGVRADKTDRNLLKRMREAGFNYICFGVESGSNKVLKRIKKSVSIETMEIAIKDACDLGFDVGLFFMVGHPGETAEDVETSIKLALKYPVAMAKFLNIIPYPGSELFNWIKENNYFVGDWHKKLSFSMHLDNEPFFITPEFPLNERRRMLKRTAKIWRETKKRHVERKMSAKYGFLGKLIVRIAYQDRLYSFLWKSYNEKNLFKRFVDSTLNLIGVHITHF
jgi:radical SAM superfamily enzyme YgiQ (UPF0313 family)|tara:strand:- start:11116 stop:12612 length:1497 start_codon:yes stop_codon:yes gene_type:complete